MNNLAYNSQDAATVGPKVEEKIREEAGGNAPIPYQVETGNVGMATVGSVMRDVGSYFVGGQENSLFRLNFDLSQPRPAQLLVNVARQGIGSHVGLLIYAAPLRKSVSGEATLEDPKMFGKAKFVGDPAVSAKLNANGQIVKLAGELARTESQCGGETVKIKRCCQVVPHEGGAMLVVNTLPRPIKMGFGATVDAKQFFELAGLIEAAL